MGKIEISYKELKSMPEDAYQLIDLRNATNTSYGMIPGAVTVLEEDLKERVIEERNKNKKIVFYCTKGILSEKTAQNFREQGMETYSLKGGYMGWLLENMETAQLETEDTSKELMRAQEIEKSIRKKFHKTLFSKFAKAIKTYDLVKEKDKIAVCISGGKDSMLMAKLFQELKRHNKFQFELVFLVMDPGYHKVNRQLIESNAEMM